MRIDNSKQLRYFLNILSKDIHDQETIKKIEAIIDVERIQTFSKKMLLLQWFFYQGDGKFQYDQNMYDNALKREVEGGLIQRFLIEMNLGLLKDDWGKENARSEMKKLATQGIVIRKDMKNYVITKVGETCALFLYFKILESVLGVKNIWKLIKADLTKLNLQNIEPKITIQDLESWFIIEKQEDNYSFTKMFIELIDFLRNHPELYPSEFKIILENLFFWVKNSIISRLDKKNIRLTLSDKKIHNYKDNLKKIDWIYRIGCKFDNLDINLIEWAKSFGKKYSKLNDFFNQCLIITAPPGYGKSILTYQLCIDLLSVHDTTEESTMIPMFLDSKSFSIRSGKVYYDNFELFNIEINIDEISNKNVEHFLLKLIGASLSDYNPNELMVKIFLSILLKNTFLLVLDGWDELDIQIRHVFIKYYKKVLAKKSDNENLKYKILITSRYSDDFLKTLIPKGKGKKSKKQKVPILALPKKEDIERYLGITSRKYSNTRQIEELTKNFHGVLTPLDLFLIGIFPLMDIPKYKTQLFERWIYYQVLSEVLSPREFKDLKSEEDIRIKLETFKMTRELDNQSFFLAQLIDGTLYGNDEDNYTLLEILPKIAYSNFNPNIERPIGYLNAKNTNPLLKRFLRPYYKGFQSFAQLADPHFYAFLIAKYIFNNFLKNSPVEPLPYEAIDDFLMEFYLQNSNDLKIKKMGVHKPEHFVCYLYLQSGIILPALQLPYNYGEIYSYALGSESINYGIYLLRAFQLEFQRDMNKKDEKVLIKILEAFQIYRKEMPTTTVGMYLDEVTHEHNYGEPQVNHSPLEYFNLIAQLFGYSQILQKSKQEMDYLNIEDKYYQHKLGFDYSQYYWKKADVQEILNTLFASNNPYIIPWYANILPSFLKNDLKVKINSEQLIQQYNTQEDPYIRKAFLSVLISSNPQEALKKSELFLKDNNLENLKQLVNLLCEIMKDKESISRELFGLWINYYKNPIISIRLQYKLVRVLFDVNLLEEQIIGLCKVYKGGNSPYNVRKKKDTEDNYIKTEDNHRELDFIFNCLILLNYSDSLKENIDDKYDLLRDSDLRFKYALEKRRYYYISLVRSSGIISDEKLENRLLLLDFNFLFSYSEEVFKSIDYDVPYFKKVGEFLADTHEFLLKVQQKWLEKKVPNRIFGMERILEKLFSNYEDHKDTWKHYTDLGGAYILHGDDAMSPEKIQLKIFFDITENNFANIKIEVAEYFFKMIKEWLLSKIDLTDGEDKHFYNDFNHLPNFITYAFKRLVFVPPDKRISWIRELINYRIPFIEFRELILDIKDISSLYKQIWEVYGKPWIGETTYHYRRRPYMTLYKGENPDISKPSEFVFLLPFKLLHFNLKKDLKWDKLENKYSEHVYNTGQEKFIEKVEDNNLIVKFGKRIQLYTLKLTGIAQYLKYEDKAIEVIAELWEKYYIYPLVSESHHPSYHIYWNLVGELPQKVYNKIKDPIAKIYLNLCRFERYFTINQAELQTYLLNQLKLFDKEEIEEALIKISKTDWRIETKFLLFLFSRISEKILPILKQIMHDIKEGYERELSFYSKPRKRLNGIILMEPKQPPKKRFPFIEIFQNEVLFDEGIIKNYLLFLSLLSHQIPDENYLLSIFSNYNEDKFEDVILKVKKLPKSDIASLLHEINHKKICKEGEFNEIKEHYVKLNKSYLAERERSYSYNSSPYSKILEFFLSTPIEKQKEEELARYHPAKPSEDNDEIKDPEIKRVIELIDKEEIEPQEVIRIIKRQGITGDTNSILSRVVPFFFIDSYDDYCAKKPPNIKRKYQKAFFWFLNELRFDKEMYKEVVGADYNKNNIYTYTERYYFESDFENYIKRLIFDGIEHHNLLEWYSDPPKSIPPQWIQKYIDPEIIQNVYFPDQINYIPQDLQESARKRAWKYIILPDLVNEVEQYFEGYRNTFPESENKPEVIDDF